MYKTIFIILLTLFLCSISFAQEQQDHWIWPDEHIEDALYLHIGVGPEISCGLAMATAPMFFDFNMKNGLAYQIGAAFNFHVKHHSSLGLHGIGRVGLEIEAMYSSQSFNAGVETMAIKCIELPILLQVYITPVFQVEAGMTPVKLFNVFPEYLQTGNVVAHVGNMKGGDIKISAGACYKTTIGLAFGFRYNQGLSELAENYHSKTSTIMVSASFLFPLTK